MTGGKRMRRSLEDLGPIFIKAGQIISTRSDLIPENIAEVLAKLQDRVPPFPGSIAKKSIKLSLNKKENMRFMVCFMIPKTEIFMP